MSLLNLDLRYLAAFFTAYTGTGRDGTGRDGF